MEGDGGADPAGGEAAALTTLWCGCDDGVVEPLIEASMPPVVADAPVGNDVEAVADEWSRIPGRVTVKYNVEEASTTRLMAC